MTLHQSTYSPPTYQFAEDDVVDPEMDEFEEDYHPPTYECGGTTFYQRIQETHDRTRTLMVELQGTVFIGDYSGAEYVEDQDTGYLDLSCDSCYGDVPARSELHNLLSEAIENQ